MLKFKELALHEIILANLEVAGYETPTPIQAQSIPTLLEGHDLLGIAQTGTGKTAAFTLPMIQKLQGRNFSLTPCEPRSLILAPTRELASQIKEQLDKYGRNLKVKNAVIFGGVGQAAQVAALRNGLDVLIATPGRLLDLMNQGHCKLNKVEIFVLDEADRMLDMGFIHDIKKIIAKLPEQKQTMLFSATMPNEIVGIANRILKNPTRVEVTPPSTTVERINQKVIFTQKAHKYQLLRKVLVEEGVELTLVFTRTKHGANKIVDYLAHFNIQSAAIHGNKSQSARETALENFKTGKIKVLVATDIAARGIDVQGVSHVINYDLPVEAESYVHRIGRTARAGKDGDAISFCDETERDALARIQKTIGKKLPTETFVGVAEQSVKMTQTDRKPYRDPRAKPKAKEPQKPQGQQKPKLEQRPRQEQRPRPEHKPAPKGQAPRRDERNENKQQPKVGFKFRKRK
ncbi:DEAD/DEAH box helicase [Peredibacter sp. HCB2-198]|uniref:DEAD/DEAH box helicase n=1 Tax=Peredibacter sp. HCB2-198 TaxID=3383025 RepID=UPI0038B48580